MSTNHASLRQAAYSDDSTHYALQREGPHTVSDSTEPNEESTHPSFLDGIGEDILRLLRRGDSVDQISTLLQISKTMVKRWQFQLTTPDFQKMDKRRLYDDAFKQAALQQINQGVSIRQLSTTLGVSQVTLHKWKNKASMGQIRDIRTRKYPPLPASQVGSQTSLEDREPSTHNEASLHQQLRDLREERDILKKALVILLRSS